jgi:hypothetical protein
MLQSGLRLSAPLYPLGQRTFCGSRVGVDWRALGLREWLQVIGTTIWHERRNVGEMPRQGST